MNQIAATSINNKAYNIIDNLLINKNYLEKHKQQEDSNNLPTHIVVKGNFVKPCKHRTETGYCIRSNRQCPATIFKISIHN